jgi:hypothetical protein
MNKNYDYWLVVWTYDNGEEVYEPVAFQVGLQPQPWCEALIEQSNNTRDARRGRLHSYKLYRLELKL